MFRNYFQGFNTFSKMCKLWWYTIIRFFSSRAVYIKIDSNPKACTNSESSKERQKLTRFLFAQSIADDRIKKRALPLRDVVGALSAKSLTVKVPFSSVVHDPLVRTDMYSCNIAAGLPVLQSVLLKILPSVSYLSGFRSLVHKTRASCFTLGRLSESKTSVDVMQYHDFACLPYTKGRTVA